MRNLTFFICVFCVLLFAVKIRANPQSSTVTNLPQVSLKPVRSVNPNTCTYQFEVTVGGVKIKIRPSNYTNSSIVSSLSRRLIFDIGDLSYFQTANGLTKVSAIRDRAKERSDRGLKPLSEEYNLAAYLGQKVNSSAMLYMVRQDLSNEQRSKNVPQKWGEILGLTFPKNDYDSVRIFSELLYGGKDSLILESNKVNSQPNQSSKQKNIIDQETLKSLFAPVQGADLQKCNRRPMAPQKSEAARGGGAR